MTNWKWNNFLECSLEKPADVERISSNYEQSIDLIHAANPLREFQIFKSLIMLPLIQIS